jgi:hypothetical protein
MLVAANLIDEVQMKIALAEQHHTGKRFGSTLVDLKFIDENVLAAFLSKQIDIPCISLLQIDIPKKVLRRMSRAEVLELKSVPIRVEADGSMAVAMVDPTDVDTLNKLEAALGTAVHPLIAPESSIQHVIEKLYPDDTIDDTVAFRGRNTERSGDPVFWDLLEEIESGDLDKRLTRIEKNLDQVWTLLERILRAVETRQPEAPVRDKQ